MRGLLTRERLREVMIELGRGAPAKDAGRVYLVGGSTAVWAGWRLSTVDLDLHGSPEAIFRDIQRIKERLRVNVEFARPEDFVPPLRGSEGRHVFIETIGNVSFFHHDPYAQVLSKIVRGFDRDLADAESFVASGMVDIDGLRKLVHAIPDAAYARYPSLSRDAVIEAVDAFAQRLRRSAPPG